MDVFENKKMNLLSISIVHYGDGKHTSNLLEKLFSDTDLPENTEILLVKNSPLDICLPSNVISIEPGKNLGFGEGHNAAFRNSNGSLFMVLNPDVLPGKNSVVSLVKFMAENPHAGIAAPKLVLPNGERQFSARKFFNIFDVIFSRAPVKNKESRTFYARHLMRDINLKKPEKVDWAAGACLLIRRSLAEKRGFIFDPRYFIYFEDVDLCLYCKRSGMHVFYVPGSEMFHVHKKESKNIFSRAALYHASSTLKFVTKHWGLPQNS